MEVFGILGISLSLVIIMILIAKGLIAVIAAPLATMIVIFTNEMPFFETLFGTSNSYVSSLGSFIIQNFAIFLLGSMLAKYMEESGATISIAKKILSIFGKKNKYLVMVSIFVISTILTLGGISLFVVVFAIIPMAKPLFKEMEIPWKLVAIPVYGGMATFTMTMFPGTPALQNVIPANTMNTPLTAAPLIGLIGSISAICFILVYMYYELKKSLENNEKYHKEKYDVEESTIKTREVPTFFKSILPIMLLLSINILFSKYKYTIIIALTISIILCTILFRNYFSISQQVILNESSQESVGSIMVIGSTVAYGNIITLVPSFSIIANLIMSIPGNPLISLTIATTIISFATGSAVGTIGIAVESFAPIYLERGLDPELVHRFISISAGVFAVMPHTGLSVTFNKVTNLSFKENFKYQFTTVFGAHSIALLLALLIVYLFY